MFMSMAILAACDSNATILITPSTYTPAPTATSTPLLIEASATTIPNTATDTAVPHPIPATRLNVNATSAPRATEPPTAETYYVQGDNTLVRACPRRNCDRLGTLSAGAAVLVDALVEGEAVSTGNAVWYQIQFDGQEGYIYSALMASSPPPTLAPPRSTTVNNSGGTGNNPIPTISNEPPISTVEVPVSTAAPLACPRNCAEARALGFSPQQAAQCPNLDGDRDGVACEN
jgi:hypothetical protein